MDERAPSGGDDKVESIDVNNPIDLRYWCSQLGCSELQLRVAVRRAGTSPEKVRSYLARE